MPAHVADRVVQPVVLEVEPLAQPEAGRAFVEDPGRPLGVAMLVQQAHVEMAVVGRALGLAMPGGRGPGAW